MPESLKPQIENAIAELDKMVLPYLAKLHKQMYLHGAAPTRVENSIKNTIEVLRSVLVISNPV